MNIQSERIDSILETVLANAASLSDRVPADLAAIARSLGVVEISERPIQFDGYLARRPDGALAIRYQQGQRRTRIRFTIAHEIGHILIANALGRPIEVPVSRAEFRDDAEEKLANRIAAELLLPANVVTSMFMESKVGWLAVSEIASVCDASVSSVVVRLGELEHLPNLQIRVRISNDGDPLNTPTLRPRGFDKLFFRDHPSLLVARLLAEMKSKTTSRSEHSCELFTSNQHRRFTVIGRRIHVRDDQYAEFITWGLGRSVQGPARTIPLLAPT